MWQYISRTKILAYQVQCVQENMLSIVVVTQKQFSFLKPLFSAHETVEVVILNTIQYLNCIRSWDFTLNPFLLLLFKWQAADWNISQNNPDACKVKQIGCLLSDITIGMWFKSGSGYNYLLFISAWILCFKALRFIFSEGTLSWSFKTLNKASAGHHSSHW